MYFWLQTAPNTLVVSDRRSVDAGDERYLALLLHLLGGPANDVDLGGAQADGRVHRDVFG